MTTTIICNETVTYHTNYGTDSYRQTAESFRWCLWDAKIHEMYVCMYHERTFVRRYINLHEYSQRSHIVIKRGKMQSANWRATAEKKKKSRRGMLSGVSSHRRASLFYVTVVIEARRWTPQRARIIEDEKRKKKGKKKERMEISARRLITSTIR